MLQIAFLLILTLPTLIASIPLTSAQVINRPTHAYITLSANPIGVGQTEVITFRIVELNPLCSGVFVTEVWRGFTVTITKPYGTTETKGPFNADSTGGYYTTFAPTQAGSYKIQTFFPGQWVNGSYTTVANTGAWSNVTGQPLKSAQLWFTPSQSAVETLTVQQNPVSNYPDNPLPTDYWTRPIYGENKGWSTIADNWLMRGYDTMNRPFQNGGSICTIHFRTRKSTHTMESTNNLWRRSRRQIWR